MAGQPEELLKGDISGAEGWGKKSVIQAEKRNKWLVWEGFSVWDEKGRNEREDTVDVEINCLQAHITVFCQYSILPPLAAECHFL